MIKGVIFDLDGVLVSTDEMHYQAWKRLADQLGIFGFTRKDNEKQRGVSRMASLEIVLEKTDRVYTEEEKVKLAEKKMIIIKNFCRKLDDGAVLKGAKENTCKTSGDGSLDRRWFCQQKIRQMILEKTGLLPYIDKSKLWIGHYKSQNQIRKYF